MEEMERKKVGIPVGRKLHQRKFCGGDGEKESRDSSREKVGSEKLLWKRWRERAVERGEDNTEIGEI